MILREKLPDRYNRIKYTLDRGARRGRLHDVDNAVNPLAVPRVAATLFFGRTCSVRNRRGPCPFGFAD